MVGSGGIISLMPQLVWIGICSCLKVNTQCFVIGHQLEKSKEDCAPSSKQQITVSTGMIYIVAVVPTGTAPNSSNTVLQPAGPGSVTKTGFRLPSLLRVFTTNLHRLGSTKLEMPKNITSYLKFQTSKNPDIKLSEPHGESLTKLQGCVSS